MKTFKDFIMENFNIMKHRDLTARAGRIELFIAKIKEGKSFLTTKGEAILDKSIIPTLENEFRQSGFKIVIPARVNGTKVSLNYPKDFYKTGEFGGKGAGSGTVKEDLHLSMFTKVLKDAMEKEKTNTVKIKIDNKIHEVAGIESTYGMPKSDFHLVDLHGKAIAWLSHKDGIKASQFQQYGGLTQDFDLHYKRSKDVMDFLNDVKKIRPDGLKRGDSIWRFVKDKNVARWAIWGKDYGRAKGINNVDEFHQGLLSLKKVGSYYEITSTHKEKNGTIPGRASSGDYTPIYVARYTSDRGGLGIAWARLGVFARDYVSGKATQI